MKKTPKDRVSREVRGAVRRLYAIMASAMAKRAVDSAKNGSWDEAEKCAERTEKWLITAGANATNWTYRSPSI